MSKMIQIIVVLVQTYVQPSQMVKQLAHLEIVVFHAIIDSAIATARALMNKQTSITVVLVQIYVQLPQMVKQLVYPDNAVFPVTADILIATVYV
jgi:hypothetical protein